jgi:hypothetical protein
VPLTGSFYPWSSCAAAICRVRFNTSSASQSKTDDEKRSSVPLLAEAASARGGGVSPVGFVRPQLVVQSPQAESQHLRGACLIVLGVLQGEPHVGLFHIADPRSRGNPQHVVLRERRKHGRWRGNRAGKMAQTNLAFSRHDHRALNQVSQLAHVTRPGTGGEPIEYFFAQMGYPAPVLTVQVSNQGRGDRRNILFAVSERRQRDVKNIQTVIQVLAN